MGIQHIRHAREQSGLLANYFFFDIRENLKLKLSDHLFEWSTAAGKFYSICVTLQLVKCQQTYKIVETVRDDIWGMSFYYYN